MNFMHMWTDATEQATRGLSQNGLDLGTSWHTAKSAIAGSESGIGKDRLGVAFCGVYTADSAAARAAADPVPDLLVDDAVIGRAGVQHYRGAETASDQAFRVIRRPT